ncbi:MAG: glycosyltransferase [Syntrophomonadaceae bacterium]|nr:glycosyltransferase [Syntrophomonadaceae bacterium]
MCEDKNWPKVSVAIITYNQKDFLRECIESILMQDYPNLEIVVADDGYTDGTHEMLFTYEKQYPGLFKLVLSDKNQGITVNSNRAYFACTGEYIAWMGGDDLMLPGKIHKQVELMEAHPEIAICYHDLEVFDSASGRVLGYFNHGKGRHYPYHGTVEKLILYGTFMGACSVMTRRTCCPKAGFDERIPVASDWLFWIETAMSGLIAYLPEILGRYRRHAGNITNRPFDGKEALLTLDIVGERYCLPESLMRRGKARVYYSLGTSSLQRGEKREARRYLVKSIRHGWYSYKWVWWIIRATIA